MKIKYRLEIEHHYVEVFYVEAESEEEVKEMANNCDLPDPSDTYFLDNDHQLEIEKVEK